MLLFYHIPKSAGSSLTTLLSYNFTAENCFTIYATKATSPFARRVSEDPFYFSFWSPEFKEVPYNKFKPKNRMLLHGHIFFKDGFLHFPNAKNITFLRDPLSRVISHQKYWEISTKYCPLASVNRSHLLPDGKPIDVANNLQVYYLSSYSKDDSTISLDQHLESAKYNLLHHFDFVGITEQFEESLQALYNHLMLGTIPAIPTVNQFSIEHSHFDEEDKQRLKKLNWADYELYQFARDLFNKKFKHFKNTQRKNIEPAQSQIDYTFDAVFDGSGWGYREISECAPYFCRTSFLKDASIRLHLKKHRYKISFLANSPIKENILKLKLLVNNNYIPLKIKQKERWICFEGFIPKNTIPSNNSSKFVFSIPTLYSPAEQGQTLDSRSIGITIARIQIQPS